MAHFVNNTLNRFWIQIFNHSFRILFSVVIFMIYVITYNLNSLQKQQEKSINKDLVVHLIHFKLSCIQMINIY